jgi:hypothetical protein
VGIHDEPKPARSDPRERLEDYLRALAWWTRRSDLFDRVLWLENSGHGLVEIVRERFGSGVHVDSGSPGEYPPVRGKGYGEVLLLERAGDVLADFDGYVLKCTGRLFVRNVRSILNVSQKHPDLVLRMTRDLQWADSRLFLVRSRHLKTLLGGLKGRVDDSHGLYLEQALATEALRMAGMGARISSWPAPPFCVGHSGTTGQRYDPLWKYATWPARLAMQRMCSLSRFPL